MSIGFVQDNFLLFSTESAPGDLYQLSLGQRTPRTLIVRQQGDINTVACDPTDMKMYWAIHATGVIYRANIDGSDTQTVYRTYGSSSEYRVYISGFIHIV